MVPNTTTLAYLAGFFDGEGCITIGKFTNKRTGNLEYGLTVETTQCNPEPLWTMKMLFGGYVGIKQSTNTGYKRLYRHQAGRRKARYFLESLLPYLIVKREEALVALEFCDLYDQKRKFLTDEILEKREIYRNRLSLLKKKEF